MSKGWGTRDEKLEMDKNDVIVTRLNFRKSSNLKERSRGIFIHNFLGVETQQCNHKFRSFCNKPITYVVIELKELVIHVF